MRKLAVAFLAFWLSAAAFAQDVRIGPPGPGQTPGTQTNDNATAGNVGEYKSSVATNGTTSGTAIISVAAPGIVTWNAHGLNAGSPVNFTTSGTLPTGATAATNFYVCSANLTANSFAFSTTVANALAGTCVTTTGSTSGTQSVFANVILASATPLDITAISLAAGDWDVSGNCVSNPAATTTATALTCTVSTTLNSIATQPADSVGTAYEQLSFTASVGDSLVTQPARFSLSAATTIHLGVQSTFATAGMNASGIIRARRVR